MTLEPTHGRIILTNENVEQIVAVAAKRRFTIGHLVDTIVYHAEEFGLETVLYTSVYPWNKQISNFNDMPYDPSYRSDVPLMTTDEFIALLETTPEIV